MKTILQMLGLRTICCNAKIVTWHSNKHYCENCEKWLDQPAPSHRKIEPVKQRIVR